MKLQMQPERWQCAITSFAMVLDLPVAELIRRVGHDGSKIIFPDLPEPKNRRGHNIYELVRIATNCGYAVTPIPLQPAIAKGDDLHDSLVIGNDFDNWTYFTNQLMCSCGVIECSGPGGYHLVAYDHGRIFDPRGYEFPYSRELCESKNLYTYCLWRMDRIEL